MATQGWNRLPLFLAFLPTVSMAAGGFRVVIDPGHGGGDLGAVHHDGASRVTEKDLTLKLAIQASRALRARGYEVVLTRNGDIEVPLSARTALANRLKADVFLSIHMNSVTAHHPTAAEGIETFILNHTSDATSKRLAYLENSQNRPNLPQVVSDSGGDPMDVALILKDLTLDANLSESKRLACSLQADLVEASSKTAASGRGARNRGVKQALFHVLLGADMPSALLEAGFMSNARDRARVLTVQGRKHIGEAVARAIERYHLQKNTPAASSALSRCKVH